jgi:hypothetical protein
MIDSVKRRPAWRAHGALCALLAMMAVAACGGGAGGAAPPQLGPAPAGTEAAPGSSAVPGGPAPGGTASAGPTGSAATPVGPLPSSPPVEMKAVMASAMVEDLRALGLDAKSLPPIEKLEPRTLRGVMKLMARSLGVKCGDCHQEGDFAAPTRRKKIAAHMWDEFAAKVSLSAPAGAAGSGGPDAPVFCDSCHQGRVQLLDRRDKKALSKWMDDNFVVRLDRHDGKSVECETCHVDMDMHFLAKWGQ